MSVRVGGESAFLDYSVARAEAQRRANVYRCDIGIEAAKEYGRLVYRLLGLPKPANRQGFELRCEVVSPEEESK